jgi:hypothetical protein
MDGNKKTSFAVGRCCQLRLQQNIIFYINLVSIKFRIVEPAQMSGDG